MFNFFVIGISHHQAPVAVRERFSALVDLEKLFYDQPSAKSILHESLVLSTCNRLEVLGVSRDLNQGRQVILAALSDISSLPIDEIRPYLHIYEGVDSARHLFRVASSLDSLVLGEPQILGQVKEAFHQALTQRQASFFISRLMHRCFRAAKRVRSETSLAGGTVSVAGAAVALARSLEGGDLSGKSMLILGAGPMAALALANLKKRSPAQLTIMNRTSGKAEALADKQGVAFRPWEELAPALLETDIVIAATGAQSPILTYENLEKITAVRGRSLTIIDIGVPRNASHDVKYLDKVVLRNIDDLNEVVWESRAARKAAAKKAEEIIEEEVAKFEEWLKSLTHQSTVTALTHKAEHIRRLELNRTLSQHDFSPEQATAIETMTAALVRRLLHDPLAFIKSSTNGQCPEACEVEKSACHSNDSCLRSIRRAFKIEPLTGNGSNKCIND